MSRGGGDLGCVKIGELLNWKLGTCGVEEWRFIGTGKLGGLRSSEVRDMGNVKLWTWGSGELKSCGIEELWIS